MLHFPGRAHLVPSRWALRQCHQEIRGQKYRAMSLQRQKPKCVESFRRVDQANQVSSQIIPTIMDRTLRIRLDFYHLYKETIDCLEDNAFYVYLRYVPLELCRANYLWLLRCRGLSAIRLCGSLHVRWRGKRLFDHHDFQQVHGLVSLPALLSAEGCVIELPSVGSFVAELLFG